MKSKKLSHADDYGVDSTETTTFDYYYDYKESSHAEGSGVESVETTTDYYYDYYSDYNYTNEWADSDWFFMYDDYELEVFSYETYVLGYLQPTLVFLIAITNIFVVGFFMTKKNNKKATDILFISKAFSDTFTGLTLVPNSIHVHAPDNKYLTDHWCNAYMILRFYVSAVFHTVSIWQTVVLCIQRYLCVCHPFIFGRICTFWKTFVSIVVMYCCAIVLHTYHLTDSKLNFHICIGAKEDPCVVSCMYIWFCLVLQHMVPCLLLILLTTVTLRELKKAQKRVSTMSVDGRIRKNSLRSTRDRVITITATLIVICFLIPELPHGIYKFVFVINKHHDINLSNETDHIILSVYEVALMISFNANFWIYCTMMHEFRHKLLAVLTCEAVKQCVPRQRSISVSSKGGSMITTLSRKGSNASRPRVLSRTTSVHSTVSENVHSIAVSQINFKEKYAENTELRPAESDPNDDVFV